jgi:hypothetical protein
VFFRPTKNPSLGINNIPRITETKSYCDALRAYLMVVTEICISRHHDTPPQRSPEIRERSTFTWLEHACFGLVAFVMQCEFGQPSQCPRTPTDQLLTSVTVGTANTIESIFGDAWSEKGPVAPLLDRLSLNQKDLFLALSHGTGSAKVIAGTYSVAFLVQVGMYLSLHFDSNVARGPLTLLPPSLSPMDLASQYDEPDKLGSATFLWPWLRDGLAGNPLAGLSFTPGRKWAGFESRVTRSLKAPMFLKLYLAPPPSADAAVNKVYFRGEGVDHAAHSFTLEGSSETETGVVIAVKRYNPRFAKEWHGVITPFGMLGVLGHLGRETSDWFWIWPQEWS